MESTAIIDAARALQKSLHAAFIGSEDFNIMNGLAKGQLVVDLDSILQYAIRGTPGRAGQPLRTVYGIESFLHEMLRRGAVLTTLAQGVYDVPVGVDDEYALLRDLARFHLLTNARHQHLDVHDASFQVAGDRLVQPEHPVAYAIADDGQASGLSEYIHAVKPSAFMLDVDVDNQWAQGVAEGGLVPHTSEPSTGDLPGQWRWASNLLRQAMSYHILTSQRLPVVQFEGHTRLGKLGFWSSQAKALVSWPFAPRHDSLAAGATSQARARALMDAMAKVGGAAAGPAAAVETALVSAARAVTASVGLGAGGWGALAATAAGLLVAQDKAAAAAPAAAAGSAAAATPTSLDPDTLLVFESYFLHLALLPVLPLQHRVVSDEVLEAVGVPEAELGAMLGASTASAPATDSLYRVLRRVLRHMMAVAQASGIKLSRTAASGQVAEPSAVPMAGPADLPTILQAAPTSTLCDTHDVRLWRLVHGLLKAGVGKAAGMPASINGEAKVQALVQAVLARGAAAGAPNSEGQILSFLGAVAAATGMPFFLPSAGARLTPGRTTVPVPWATWADRLYGTVLPPLMQKMAAARTAAKALPLIPAQSITEGSFLRAALGPAADALAGLGQAGAQLRMARRPALDVFYDDGWHVHVLRQLRVTRRPRELRLMDAVTISNREAGLTASTDISASAQMAAKHETFKKAQKQAQKAAKQRLVVAEGMQGGIIKRHEVVLKPWPPRGTVLPPGRVPFPAPASAPSPAARSREEEAGGHGGAGGGAGRAIADEPSKEQSVNSIVQQKAHAFDDFVKEAKKSEAAYASVRERAAGKPAAEALEALLAYGSDRLEASCQFDRPDAKQDRRCGVRRPEIGEEIEVMLKTRFKGQKKAQEEHKAALNAALGPAQLAWDAWSLRDMEHDMEILARRLALYKALPPAQRGPDSQATAYLFHAAEALIGRYWPSLYAQMQQEDGTTPTSWGGLQARVQALLGMTSDQAKPAREPLVRDSFMDILTCVSPATEGTTTGDARARVRAAVESSLLPALMAIEPCMAYAARVTLALLTVGTGLGPSKDGTAAVRSATGVAPLTMAGELWMHSSKPSIPSLQALWSTTISAAGADAFPSFALWQLQAIPQYLLRPRGVDDGRVRGFRPDKWQLAVMDAIDKHQSALVSVPTSAGKTMIAYYAMEEVLSRSNDDILVYVAPTKALCDQVAAEISARFNKSSLKAGRAMVGLFVADKRFDEEIAQVLVCVPQTLEILLLSARQQGWASRLRRIILDEVHNAVTESGEVWERLLLYLPRNRLPGCEFGDCRILALSATIGEFERFRQWLADVERGTGLTLTTVPDANTGIISRWNDLSTSVFVPPISGSAGAAAAKAGEATAVVAAKLETLRPAEVDAPDAGDPSAAAGEPGAGSDGGAPPEPGPERPTPDGGPPAPPDHPVPAQLVRVHPVGSLDYGRLGRNKPALDMHLLPEEAVELHRVLMEHTAGWAMPPAPPAAEGGAAAAAAAAVPAPTPQQRVHQRVESLSVSRVFGSTTRITMQQAHTWGRNMLDVLHDLAEADAVVTQAVLDSMRAASSRAFDAVDTHLRGAGQRRYLTDNIASAVEHLRQANMLPAITFHMSRPGCAMLAGEVATQLMKKEQAYRGSQAFSDWLERRHKELARQQAIIARAEAGGAGSTSSKSGGGGADRAEGAGKDAKEDAAVTADGLAAAREKAKRLQREIEAAQDPCLPLGREYTLFPEPHSPHSPPTLGEIAEFTRKDPTSLAARISGEVAKWEKYEDVPSKRLKSMEWALLLRGVAFHHGGCSPDYRQAVEYFFRRRQLRLVVATATLSQGINMPCRTVLLAGDSSFIDALNYRQMCGRAGRRGYDLRGNVVLFGLPSPRILHHMSAVLPGMSPSCPVTLSHMLRLVVRYDNVVQPSRYELIQDGTAAGSDVEPRPDLAARLDAMDAMERGETSWDADDEENRPAGAPPAPPARPQAIEDLSEVGWDDDDDAAAAPAPAAGGGLGQAGVAPLPPQPLWDQAAGGARAGAPLPPQPLWDRLGAAAGGAGAHALARADSGRSDLASLEADLLRPSDVQLKKIMDRARLQDVRDGMQRLLNHTMQLFLSPDEAPMMGVYLHYFMAHLQAGGLVSAGQRPLPLAGIPVNLHYTEPSNVIFVSLLQDQGIARLVLQLCKGKGAEAIQGNGSTWLRSVDPDLPLSTVQRDMGLLHLLAFLFRRDRPTTLGEDPATQARTIMYFRSLPPHIRASIRAQNAGALDLLKDHLRAYALQQSAEGEGRLPPATTLPISGASRPSSGPDSLPRVEHAAAAGGGAAGGAAAAAALGAPADVSSLFGSLASPLLLPSPFFGLSGEAKDAFSSLADTEEGMRPGMRVDPSLVPVLPEDLPVSRWVVDLYVHGRWNKVVNEYGVDDGAQWDSLDQFLRTLKAIATALSVRWWSIFTSRMTAAAPGAPTWTVSTHGGRWRSPESLDADVTCVYEDIEERVRECGMEGETAATFREHMRVLTTELPVVQAFRGLAARYARVYMFITGKDARDRAQQARAQSAAQQVEAATRAGGTLDPRMARLARLAAYARDEPLVGLRHLDEFFFNPASRCWREFAASTQAMDTALAGQAAEVEEAHVAVLAPQEFAPAPEVMAAQARALLRGAAAAGGAAGGAGEGEEGAEDPAVVGAEAEDDVDDLEDD